MSKKYNSCFLERPKIIGHEWDSFIKNSPQHSIYFNSEYLDVICPGWGAFIISRDSEWLAVIPVNISQKAGIHYSFKPLFAQFLGPALSYRIENHETGYIVKLLLELVSEKVKVFDHCLHPSLSDCRFPEVKYASVEKFYNYELSLNVAPSVLYAGFSTSVTNHIKKAERAGLTCIISESADKLVQISLASGTLSLKQAQSFNRLWDYVKSVQGGFILYATDKDGLVHSGGAFIINGCKLTFICSATDRRYKKIGGNSLLIWEAIKKGIALKNISYFDFEGSMLNNVDKYFKGFHPLKIEYIHVRINQLSNFMNVLYNLKRYIKAHIS